MSFGEFLTKEVDRDLKLYCIKHWGTWWATRFLMNEKAAKIYEELRACSMAIVIQAIANDDSNYQKYIQIHVDLLEEFKKDDKGDKIHLKK